MPVSTRSAAPTTRTRLARLLPASAVVVAVGTTALVVGTTPAQEGGAWDTIARCESTANWVPAGPSHSAGVDYRTFGTQAPAPGPAPATPSGGCPAAP